ncbi:hypothetical protein SAMN04488109_0322 [Chryseolinea serpens]|uniref:Uncharacterized protein n=1 Tax=Chryseolinea serpens TaxID=947013 RepID=A0A1M5JXZ1_9BACT|nr:hypothetical protein [Chryseolinea serpens]SHG44893.1 hypothetical protein SAMN04488109_0322 [Chryseolinea serpens]
MNTYTTTDVIPELVTGFDLNNPGTEQHPVYQFVYASQLYGSVLFAIYGRFETTKDGDNYLLKAVNLKLLNYQGVINIGFTGEEPVYSTINKESGEEARIYFGVTAMSSLREARAPIEPYLPVVKGTRCTITFCRILYALPGFNAPPPGNTNDGEIYRKPSNVTTPDGMFFDPEFHGRSGVDYFLNPLRPGMAGYEKVTLENLRDKNNRLGSPRCSQSVVKLYI